MGEPNKPTVAAVVPPTARVQISVLSSKLLPPFHVMIQIEPCRPAPDVVAQTFRP